MKILFYLPVVTDSWLETIAPLIGIAARDAEVHVIVPSLWEGAGVAADRIDSLARSAGGTWHLIDDVDHMALRTGAPPPPRLLPLVARIAADYTICRSADVALPRTFPGRISFLMEADYPPLARGRMVRLSGPGIFDHCAMPLLTDGQKALLTQPLKPLRDALLAKRRSSTEARTRFLAGIGLPEDCPIVAMPLEHDGSDNFYMLHSPSPVNAMFVEEIAAGLAKRCVLALTIHPAQRRDTAVMARLSALGGERIRILSSANDADLTPALARHCDGMVFRDSKSITWAAMFEKPIFRRSRFESGGWLDAYSSLALFDAAVGNGSAHHPSLDDAIVWLAFHLANHAFKTDDPELTLSGLIDRIDYPLNPSRWIASLSRRDADLSAAALAITSMGA